MENSNGYIAIKDGENVSYHRIPTFGEFTVADWKRLCVPPNTEEGNKQLLEEVRRMIGVPMTKLKRLPIAEYDKLIDAYVKLRKEASERQAEVDNVDFTNPETITHDGVVYRVPKDIETQGTIGQWADMITALAEPKTEAELHATICGVFLVPEGAEYEGPIADRFENLPVRVAMGLSAFFLGSSERLRNAMHQYTVRQLTLKLRALGQGEASSTSPLDPVSTS